MTLESRAIGWLDSLAHARVRELLCHALSRYQIVCPVYCLMPDHLHLLLIGWNEHSDQRRAVALLRTAWNAELRRGGRSLQRQSYDHVLRDAERAHGAFVANASYVLANPERANVVANWCDYPYLGSMVPGYPIIDPRAPDFWERFWQILALHLTKEAAKA
jgi:hypothetical protein